DGMAHTHDLLEGEATIRATYNQGTITPLTDDATLLITEAIPESLTIEPPSQSTPLGSEADFTAWLTDSDGNIHEVTEQVYWQSLNPNYATMDSTRPGTAVTYGHTTGTATIRATFNTGTISPITDDATLIVTPPIPTSISLQPTDSELYVNTTTYFEAYIHYSDGVTITNVTNDANTSWQSGNTDYVTISNNTATKGQALGIAEGDTTIQVAYFMPGVAPLTASTPISIIRDTVTGYVIEETATGMTTVTMQTNDTKMFSAYLLYQSGDKVNVTDQTHWSVDPHHLASVDNNKNSPSETVRSHNATGTATINGKYQHSNIYATAATIIIE
uniref:Ig-like domain-containing protein n=1 Tax=uncultured Shewanella sp. TaxID=173975 RepID=UPI002631946A